MSCIICGADSSIFGKKGAITVAYCTRHAMDCVNAKAACFCRIP